MSPISRRICIDRNTPEEKAIRAAIAAVEAMPADPRLTKAVVALADALEWVSDYEDGVPDKPTREEELRHELVNARATVTSATALVQRDRPDALRYRYLRKLARMGPHGAELDYTAYILPNDEGANKDPTAILDAWLDAMVEGEKQAAFSVQFMQSTMQRIKKAGGKVDALVYNKDGGRLIGTISGDKEITVWRIFDEVRMLVRHHIIPRQEIIQAFDPLGLVDRQLKSMQEEMERQIAEQKQTA